MSGCPFATGWVKVVANTTGACGCSLPEGQAFHNTVAAIATAMIRLAGTIIGRVRITKSVLCDRDPCAPSDLITETVRRNPTITAFHMRPSPGDYGSLVESLVTCMPSHHARIHSHYMAAHPVDANPPTSLRFTSTKPKPGTLSKEAGHKDAAKRKLFLCDPQPSAEETLPIYSLPSRSQREWDGDGPGLTVPSAYAAQGLLALPMTATPPCVDHDDPVLEVAAESPVNSDCTQLPTPQHLLQRNFWTPQEVEDAHNEALGIADDRSARIFNQNRPDAGRTEDPADRKMVLGKPEDTSRHPEGEHHIRLWFLPCLTLMVNRVMATFEGILRACT